MNNRKGFTLVELMICIAILAGFIIPGIGHFGPVIKQVKAEENGWIRKEMKDLENKIGEITLAWWLQLIIAVISFAFMWLISHLLLNNQIRRSHL